MIIFTTEVAVITLYTAEEARAQQGEWRAPPQITVPCVAEWAPGPDPPHCSATGLCCPLLAVGGETTAESPFNRWRREAPVTQAVRTRGVCQEEWPSWTGWNTRSTLQGRLGATLTPQGALEVSGHLGTVWRRGRPLLAQNDPGGETRGRSTPAGPGDGSKREKILKNSSHFCCCCCCCLRDIHDLCVSWKDSDRWKQTISFARLWAFRSGPELWQKGSPCGARSRGWDRRTWLTCLSAQEWHRWRVEIWALFVQEREEGEKGGGAEWTFTFLPHLS